LPAIVPYTLAIGDPEYRLKPTRITSVPILVLRLSV
jgi:hypothetical protein